jgi:nitrogen fixation protein FixH
MNSKTFTGHHMAMILVAFFGVVIAVNFTMAWFASSTFGGLVVENSYVASQKFNGWLQKARDEKALDWTLEVSRGEAGRLNATLVRSSEAIDAATIDILARHPLGRLPERKLSFRELGAGRYRSVQPLPAGRWILHVEAHADGRVLHRVVDLQ